MSVKAKTKKKLELVFCLFFFFKQFVFIIFSKILGSQQIADFKKGKNLCISSQTILEALLENTNDVIGYSLGL